MAEKPGATPPSGQRRERPSPLLVNETRSVLKRRLVGNGGPGGGWVDRADNDGWIGDSPGATGQVKVARFCGSQISEDRVTLRLGEPAASDAVLRELPPGDMQIPARSDRVGP